ncbi:LLM class flavin-dependent oxidoreductase [Nonomuraea sp. NPDC049141]|uniref:LLM class flavin-dependent oxidoreductase n=1 Tax=unclassified Nonomuraea TaxID=2593643 RepID=UPI0033EAD97B
MQVEHELFFGLGRDPLDVRASRLEESVQVIKGLWGPEPFQFKGEHYTVHTLNGLPKPVQQPHPPIRVGAFGKRVLSLAARVADTVGIVARKPPT